MHSECAQVRLVDRCVRCNPGYNDSGQAYEIYLAVKGGMTLRQAEAQWVANHEARKAGRQTS